MKKIKITSEDEMVLEFLKMELNSDRFSNEILRVLKDMGLDETLITKGNLLDSNENETRSKILGDFRGYKQNKDLFENFPNNISWYWAILEAEDLSKIKYVNYSYWNKLSNYTSSPLEAAKTIVSGKEIYDVSNEGFLKALDYLRTGKKFPPLILLTDMNNDDLIILEGHKRITAYAIDPSYFKNVSALIGFCSSEDLANWKS